jgi:hypothetical protein
MVGISRHIPLRDIAVQSGISYGAARVRVHRLRERFVKLARQHVVTLEPDERVELQRFFRRAGVLLDDKHPGAVSAPREAPTPAHRTDEETSR